MKKRIENAIEVHQQLHNEPTTKDYIAAVLWPKNTPKQQKANFGNLLSGRTKLTADQITILIQEFPDTNGDYWLDLIPYDREMRIFLSTHKVSEMDKNEELALLFQLLQEHKFVVSLYDKYI